MNLIFAPNIFSLSGIILLIIGVFTLPLLIGFLIMPIGSVLLVIGIHLSLIQSIPGYKKYQQLIINSYKPYIKWKKQ